MWSHLDQAYEMEAETSKLRLKILTETYTPSSNASITDVISA
jgi:hypothetical protein